MTDKKSKQIIFKARQIRLKVKYKSFIIVNFKCGMVHAKVTLKMQC